MSTIVYIILGVLILLIVVNISAIYLAKKGLTKDENNNMIPDILEEKFSNLQDEVKFRVDRVGEELKDVSKAIKEVGSQIADVPKAAATGKSRAGRKPRK
jgi:hypothetical protein